MLKNNNNPTTSTYDFDSITKKKYIYTSKRETTASQILSHSVQYLKQM